MNAGELTPEIRAALVSILIRAARRGREVREQMQNADLGELGGQTQAGGGDPTAKGRAQSEGYTR
jgi:hypothetical protein